MEGGLSQSIASREDNILEFGFVITENFGVELYFRLKRSSLVFLGFRVMLQKWRLLVFFVPALVLAILLSFVTIVNSWEVPLVETKANQQSKMNATTGSRVSLRVGNQVKKGIEGEKPLFGVEHQALTRSTFPPGFIFGTATAAYQVEGGASEGGREPSTWDAYAHKHPDLILDGSNGDVAADQFHHYKEDVELMKEMGMDAYRFSISWSRILPKGTIEGGVNMEGVNYYNNLIDELVNKGIKPFVTLYHFDFPQALQDIYNDFLDKRIVDDFKAYAELCFEKFGDRVKHWITINEPWVTSFYGYCFGAIPPTRCTRGCFVNGDSAREPYIVTHHQLLAHAAVVALYREKYQANQKGKIGIPVVTSWPKPYDNSHNNVQASERWLEFAIGWIMQPLTTGDYPFSMSALVGDRLPSFTEEEKKMVKGSFDFIGLHYYFAAYAVGLPLIPNARPQSYYEDTHVRLVEERHENGNPSGKLLPPDLNNPYPLGIYKLLLYLTQRYNNPPIYITENGMSQSDFGNLTREEALKDKERLEYHKSHLKEVLNAMKGPKVDVRGYFAWSLLDNFDWRNGFTKRFGLIYVDYIDNHKRYPKDSFKWFKEILSK